jgi:hypothetical protein
MSLNWKHRSPTSPLRPSRIAVAPRACLESLEARQLLSGSGAPSPSGDAPALTPSLHVAPFRDPRGDILPTYTGVPLPGMDVVAHKVTIDGDRMVFYAKMAGRVEPTQEIGGLYLFGVDRGRGTARFLGPASPPVIGPNVLWDSIVRVNPDGTGLFNNILTGVITPLDQADIKISGNHFTASVPLTLMLPGAAKSPGEWTYNLWPRNGIGRNVQVSDLAPDDGNAPVQMLSPGGSSGESRERQTYAAVAASHPRVSSIADGRSVSVDYPFSDAGRIVDDLTGAGGGDDIDLLE